MLTVNTNMPSVNALNNLSETTIRLKTAFERISSGLRINKAGDDAAGLGMAENIQAVVRGLRQASRNANDGISVLEVAEGATNEVANIVKRMRELAVQSSSETMGTTERAFIVKEYDQLEAEIDRIANVTEFNGVVLASGTNTGINVQVGVECGTNNQIRISLGDLRATNASGLNIGNVSLGTAANAQTALSALDAALNLVNSYRADYGAVANRLESSMRNLSTYTESLIGAESRIRDADYAYETSALTKLQVMQQAGVAVLGQANQLGQAALRLLG
jgi:flagellin